MQNPNQERVKNISKDSYVIQRSEMSKIVIKKVLCVKINMYNDEAGGSKSVLIDITSEEGKVYQGCIQNTLQINELKLKFATLELTI